MPRPACLITVLLIAALVTACGTARKEIIIEDDALMATATTPDDDGTATTDDDADEGAGTPAGNAGVPDAGAAPPSRIAILVIPGLGYSVAGDRATLDEIDDLLRHMAKANRYADVQIRTHESGSASMIQPILDLTERHGLVNVTLHDGR